MSHVWPLDRRGFLSRGLQQGAAGLGCMSLAALLEQEARGEQRGVLRTLHHPPRAKRVVQLFMADYSASVFDSVRLTGRTDKDPRPPDRGNNTP